MIPHTLHRESANEDQPVSIPSPVGTLPVRQRRTKAETPGHNENGDDAELAAALKSKNPQALTLLFRRYSGLVLAVALGIIRERGEAEEVVQEVFLYIYERSHLFDASKGCVRSWIIRIAASRALDRKLYLARRGFYSAPDGGALKDTLLSTSDLDFELQLRLTRKRLECSLHLLTAMQRRTIECFYFDGLDLREISERLGEPLSNVRHHLYRGLARLRKNLTTRE